MTLSQLPSLNAMLNSLCTLLLIAGFVAIHNRKNVQLHKILMLAATAVSALFLTSYLIYHFNVKSVRFTDPGTIRYFYYALLLTHVIGAMVNLPMILLTLYHALKGNDEKHRRIAKKTFPLWLYVSITGVLVYFMLYRWFPSTEIPRA